MNKKKGFTLVELLVVVAILAILVIGVIPNIFDKYVYAKKEMFLSSSKALIKESKNTYSNDILKGIKNDHYSSTDNKINGLDENYNYCVSFNDNGSIKSAIIYNNNYYVISFSFEEMLSFNINDIKEYDEELIKDCVNAVKVTFDANGGSIPPGTNWTGEGNSATKEIVYTKKYNELPVPERTGYSFIGWYTSLDEDSTKITKDSTVEENSNHTLYAKWTEKKYTLTINLNGGSCTNCASSGQKKYGTTINLGTPSKENYLFTGWKIVEGTGNLIDNNIIISDSDINVQAQWFKSVYTFDYTGSVSSFTIPLSGNYKLEVWGAQGGNVTNCGATVYGGKGGYATGTKSFTANQVLYIVIGGQGAQSTSRDLSGGGYNGGGNGKGCLAYIPATGGWTQVYDSSAGGGGATHIATTNRGILSNYSNNKDEILIVGGGGGGAYRWSTTSCYVASSVDGASGGGTTGNNSTYADNTCRPTGGSQTSAGICGNHSETAGSFGKGGDGNGNANSNDGCSSGGGAGYYGGGGRWDDTNSISSGAGGSSYMSSTLNNTSTIAGQKSGNGYVKITLLNLN